MSRIPLHWRAGDRAAFDLCGTTVVGVIRHDPWCPASHRVLETDPGRYACVRVEELELVPLPKEEP